MPSDAQRAAGTSVVARYRALLAVSEAIMSRHDLGELFRDLTGRLSPIIRFDYVSVLLHDAAQNVMRLHLREAPGESRIRAGWTAAVEGSASGWVWRTQQPLVVHDIDQERRFPLTTEVLREQGRKSFYAFPLTSARAARRKY
jgi:formate hydrogenlyase transcriptional activator